MTVFGLLTYRNIKHLQQGQKRTTIERQLGQMLTLQVICVFVATCAYTTQNFYTLITMYIPKTPLRQAQENVGLAIALFFSFTCYTFNFYLYLIFSPSFRKQFTKVLKRCLGGDRNSVKPSNGALTRNTHKTCNTRSTRNGLSMVAFDGPPQQCSVVFLPKPSQVTKQSCN
ncbi:unnamed protein product [Didymodactylos carnosus]|nr:unnamed protein product [Didymodactylos carnosus]CAF4398304.1 unnamed protein product [Didymodactylos carnosus]